MIARPRRLVVSLFCGGRGGASLIRELTRQPQVELNALINAYDDGLSTGELRGFIPGMLGPSDFRKNLSGLLDLHSSHQYAVTRLLEFRLPASYSADDLARLRRWVAAPASGPGELPGDLQAIVDELDPEWHQRVRDYLARFLDYQSGQSREFNFPDCSLGNLVFAGAYLKNDRNFNAATAELARVFGSRAKLINVTQGENRILVALKADGEILEREARVVGPQSPARITDIFLLEHPLAAPDLARLAALPDAAARRSALQALERPVALSPEAREALARSDIIIYGPGTQFSSLMPSYKTAGLAAAIAESPARVKAFVVNIHRDHDIESCDAPDLVRTALGLLDPSVEPRRLVTHVLYTRASVRPERLLPRGPVETAGAAGPVWVEGDFENPARAGVHSGFLTVRRLLALHEQALTPAEPELDIYVDLNKRSLAMNQLVQEFTEMPWRSRFSRVRLRFNNVALPPLSLPPHLSVESVRHDDMFSEVVEIRDWAARRQSQYLVTLTGDGEYRLRDILLGVDTLANHPFAAVYGSRNQSRYQFHRSLDSAYGESRLLYSVSLLGAFLLSVLFTLRFRIIFSDPLTGFRLFSRTTLAPVLPDLARLDDRSATAVTRTLVRHGCEIAEIPVYYRTFKGFTNVRWRLLRGVRNAWRILF